MGQHRSQKAETRDKKVLKFDEAGTWRSELSHLLTENEEEEEDWED